MVGTSTTARLEPNTTRSALTEPGAPRCILGLPAWNSHGSWVFSRLKHTVLSI
jgi:hypothetical protein